MYLDLYKIEGTVNLDSNPCFTNPNTFPKFQEGLEIFKEHMTSLVFEDDRNMGVTFYKFGDGDYFFKQFSGKIGLIDASEKLSLIEELMNKQEYKDYLSIDSFNDYIHYPQKYACDDIDSVEKYVGEQLRNSTSKIFLLGIGHSKSAILHRLKKYTDSIFMDVGAGIDMIAGCINTRRPYAGDWTNYRIEGYDYTDIDYLNYSGEGKEIILR